jgi:phage minor structural protein
MLFILDNKQNTIGVANNGSPHSIPYFNDWHTTNLEGVNTYEFEVPAEHPDAKMFEVEGHVIVRDLDGNNLLFTIKEIQDGHNTGKRIKYIFCEDTAITELLSDVQRPAKFETTTLEYVVRSIMENATDWELGDVPFTGSFDVEFSDYMTLLEALRQVVSQFGKEMYFTVELNGTKIARKKLNIVDELGSKSMVRFDYSYDLKGVGRTEDSSKVISALVGVGKGDNAGTRVNLSTVGAFVEGDFYKENGADWIGSETALQRWGKNGKHRFGVYLNEDADTPEELKRKTLKELEKRIIPDVHYSSSITTLERITGYEAKKIRLGDTVVINDKSFEPAILINGRIKELKRSYTRKGADEVSLGSYKPITISPNTMVRDLQKLITKKENLWGTASEPLYTWVVYADSPTTGISLDPTGKDYIGVSPNNKTSEPSLNYSDYSWSYVKGERGETGERGLQGIQGETGEQGIAGSDGKDGVSSYTHIAYSDSADGSVNFSVSDSNRDYIGMYVDSNLADSTDHTKYNWTLVKGADGERGIAGQAGEDGRTPYFHVAYANSADGSSGFSTTVSSGKLYIGTYTDFNVSDSTIPSTYNWTKIKGEQGEKGVQGIEGKAGADGKTTYTWVRYADDENGNGMSQYPEGKRYLGLAYNKLTATEGDSASDYTWSPLYDNVVVGSRNLLLESKEVLMGDGRSSFSYEVMEDESERYVRGTQLAGTASGYMYSWVEDGNFSYPFEMGTKYMISADVRLNATNKRYRFGVRNNVSDGSHEVFYPDKTTEETGWHRTSQEFVFTKEYDKILILIGTYEENATVDIRNIKVEKGNIATDYTQAPEDTDRVINEIVNNTSQTTLVGTIVESPEFQSIMSDKANAEDISGLATGEMVTGAKDEAIAYVDGRIDSEGGVNEKINAVSSSLEKTANAINAKFKSSGGVNLIKNSIGYADLEEWEPSGIVGTIQNKELEQLGFGSGFFSKVGESGYIEQTVNIQPRDSEGELQKHSLSMWLRKYKDNLTNGGAGIEIYVGDNATPLAFIGKDSGQGVTKDNGLGWELGIYTFTTEYSEIRIRVVFDVNAEAYVSGLMLNVGEDALQWQHANGEVYNTNIKMNLNGIKVINEGTNGYTIMSPQEFSGYAEVLNDDNQPEMKRIFTLNGATTEVTQLDVDNEIKMQTLTMRMVDTGTNKGWAFVADE